MPHRKKPLSPAPPTRVASAHQGPRVFGFTNPDHRRPPAPAQPGLGHKWSAQEVKVDNKRTVKVQASNLGPAQPGLNSGAFTAKN
eukprot:5258966-Amphidinium_carterae.1